MSGSVGFGVGSGFGVEEETTADDINPALPIVRSVP